MRKLLKSIGQAVPAIAFILGVFAFIAAATSHLSAAFLLVLIAMLIATPQAIITTIQRIITHSRHIEAERQSVEQKIAEGQRLSMLTPESSASATKHRKFFISWAMCVFFVCVSLVVWLFWGWASALFMLGGGLSSLFLLFFATGSREKELIPGSTVKFTDYQGAIWNSKRTSDSKDNFIVNIPPAIYSSWRNYHLALTVFRCAIALWLFFACIWAIHAIIVCVRGEKSGVEVLNTFPGDASFGLLVISPAVLFALVVGGFSRWRVLRWEHREQNQEEKTDRSS